MAKKFIVAVDLGGTNLKIALVDLKYRIIYKKFLKTQKFINKESLILELVSSVSKMISSANLKKNQILGIGLGLPGPIDVRKGLVHFFPNIRGWNNVALRRILEKRLKIPVYIDNDAKLMTLAEHKLGAAKGFNYAICLTLGTGVGGGIISQGRLYRGANNASAEIGHLPINEKGPRCNCGGRACLEAYVGNKRILSTIKEKFGRDVSLEELSVLAKKNNSKALAIWNQVGEHLGVAISGLINILNPDCVVIGGGIANAGKFLFESIRKTISNRAMSVQARHAKVLKAKLGADAGLIGAAILAKEGICG